MKYKINQNRNWYLFDLNDKVLGRVSSDIIKYLRGKHLASFTANNDNGDYVVVLNASKIKITGNKLEQKRYYKHTGYIGNLKEISMKDLMEKSPETVVKHSIAGMLPKNKLRDKILGRLKIYTGTEHPHKNIKFTCEFK